MSRIHEKYTVLGVDLNDIRNRNEARVAKCLSEMLMNRELADICPDIIKDVYACALNNLPARYTQQGTIVLRDPVRPEFIEQTVSEALEKVLKNPKKRPAS